MSNGQDIALHFLMLPDEKCPTLDHVLAALAAQDGHGALAPLPAGVTFDAANTGAVLFADGDHKSEPFFWIGALASLIPGSQQYANVAYNTQVEEFVEERGWLEQKGRQVLPIGKGLLTGLPGWDTENGPVFSPEVRSIPILLDTVPKALEFVDDPKKAWAKYGPK